MCALGVDGILSATPYYNKPTQGGLEQHFRAVLDASTKPVILYNVPGRTAVNMAPSTVLRLASHPNAYGIKEASGDVLQAMQILKDRPSTFMVLSGEDALTLPLMASGADGLISVASNEIPRAMTTLTRLCRTGDFRAAQTLHYRLLPLLNANFIETNPAPVKAALAMMGRIENVLRLPLIPISDTTRRSLATALRDAGCEGIEVAA
jgi:4-hydroxy-tetrahydrodipicolinate synthase